MVPKRYMEVLRIVYDRLSRSAINWVVTGSLGMALQGMKVEIHDIDLQTDEQGAYEIEERLREYVHKPVRFVSSQRIRSHLGALEIEGIEVEIMGALQKSVDGREWEAPVEVSEHRRFVSVDGMNVPVLSLEYERNAYVKLGRLRKAAAIDRWLKKRISIVPFRPKDQDAVRNLVLDGLQEHWGVLDESKNPDLDDISASYRGGVFLVAWRDDEVVGTGAFLPVSGETVQILRMSVRKELRRQGIGREILRELCWLAYQKGYRKAMLETTASWQDAVEFYKAFGFGFTHYEGEDAYFEMELQQFVERERERLSGDS